MTSCQDVPGRQRAENSRGAAILTGTGAHRRLLSYTIGFFFYSKYLPVKNFRFTNVQIPSSFGHLEDLAKLSRHVHTAPMAGAEWPCWEDKGAQRRAIRCAQTHPGSHPLVRWITSLVDVGHTRRREWGACQGDPQSAFSVPVLSTPQPGSHMRPPPSPAPSPRATRR